MTVTRSRLLLARAARSWLPSLSLGLSLCPSLSLSLSLTIGYYYLLYILTYCLGFVGRKARRLPAVRSPRVRGARVNRRGREWRVRYDVGRSVSPKKHASAQMSNVLLNYYSFTIS
jgi:hypothetical protein